jgi:hypothetical protein
MWVGASGLQIQLGRVAHPIEEERVSGSRRRHLAVVAGGEERAEVDGGPPAAGYVEHRPDEKTHHVM